MKRRKAETLAESVVSLAVFGIIMAGVCDFMSTQTNFIARTKKRDELMYRVQQLSDNKIFEALIDREKILEHDSYIEATNDKTWKTASIDILERTVASFDWNADKKILTVKINNSDSMNFSLPK